MNFRNIIASAVCIVLAHAAYGVKEVSNKNELEKIIKDNTNVVIDYHATWCGPCKSFAPTFDSLATQFSGKAQFIKINIETNLGDKSSFAPLKNDVQSVPTFVLFKNGKEVDRCIGANKANLIKAIESAFGK